MSETDVERKVEEIIAICGAYVPGGWAHPGEECSEKITEVITGAPAQQGVTASTEEEAERAKELKASQQWMEQLQHARHAGLAKLKGACAYAAGFSIAAEHGYAGEHATAWRYGWEYARDFLSDPNVKNAMKPICPSPSTEEGK